MRIAKYLLAALVVLAMIIPVTGCGEKEQSFAGTLTNAFKDTLVVTSGDDVMEFTTSDQTSYELGDEEMICIGDDITVEYHQDKNKVIADDVVLQKHVKKELTMEGEVSDLNPTTLTVTSASLTVTFTYDKDTAIEGELNEGDEVLVTYEGNLSENPRAVNIKVEQEQQDDPVYEAHGIIADVSPTSVLLSMDSATARRFIINAGTKINSEDNRIEIGDRAEISFTGDIDKGPVATVITVHHQAKKNQYVIDGTVEKAGGTSFLLNTGKNRYTFLINGDTRFTGIKYRSGVKATVTYTGDLREDPLAVAVYCAKGKPKPKPTKKPTTEKPTTEAPTTETPTTEKPTTEKPTTETPTTEEPTTEEPTTEEPTTEEPTTEEPTTESPTPPGPVVVEAEGTIEEWGADELGNTCSIILDDQTEIELNNIEKAVIPCGYFPQAGDHVKIKYDSDSMDLLEIQLLDRADPDPENEHGGNPSEGTSDPDATQATTEEPTTTTEAPTTTTEAPTTTTEKPTTTAAPEPDNSDDSGDAGDGGDEGDE